MTDHSGPYAATADTLSAQQGETALRVLRDRYGDLWLVLGTVAVPAESAFTVAPVIGADNGDSLSEVARVYGPLQEAYFSPF